MIKGHTRSRALMVKLQNWAGLRESVLPDVVASAGITFLRHKPSNPESIERPGSAPGGGEQAVGGTAHMRTQPSTHCQETLACFLPPYLWFNLHPMFRKQNSEFTKSMFQIYLFLFMYLPVCLCEHVCTTCRQTLRGQKRA